MKSTLKIKSMVGAFALMLLLITMGPASSAEAEKKTLTRTEDPVVAMATEVPSMMHASIKKLSLMKYEGEGFSPIPFQVDERDPATGRFVYTLGEKADPSKGDGTYTGADELVFMAWDVGDKAPAESEVPCGSSKSAEIEVKDPKNGGKGWVYLFECSGAPPLSKLDYAKHESAPDRDWVKTDRYHFSEPNTSRYFARLALKGESGKVGRNLVDRIKGRAKINALGGLIKLNTPESSLKGNLQCYIDGPVRVVHLMIAYIELAMIKLNLGGQAENLFYPNYFVTPIEVDMPFNPSAIMKTFNMRYAIDWRKEMEGAKYYDPINTKGVVLDGKMSADEKKLNYTAEHDWYGLAGPQGNLVVHAKMPGKWKNIVKLKLYYVDDLTAMDPPEEDPGQRCPGFMIDSMVDISAGKYHYYLYYMVPEVAPPESAPAMLDIIKHPLKTGGKKFK